MGVRVTSHPPELVESEVTEAGRVSEVVTGMKRVVRGGRANPPADVHFVLLSRPARRHEGGLAVIIVVCIVKVVVVVGRVVARRAVAGLNGRRLGVGGGRPVGGRTLVQVERSSLVSIRGLLLPSHPHSLLGRLEGLLLLLLLLPPGILVGRGRVVLLLLRLTVGVGGGRVGGRRGGGSRSGDFISLITSLNLLIISLSLVLYSLIDLTERLRWPSPNKHGRQSLP